MAVTSVRSWVILSDHTWYRYIVNIFDRGERRDIIWNHRLRINARDWLINIYFLHFKGFS